MPGLVQIQLRRDSAANWTATNPTLAEGEIGIETDTLKMKIGNGVTAWNTLPYYNTLSLFTYPASVQDVANAISLVGDNATPGNTKYYGTNGAGAKGFYTLLPMVYPGAGIALSTGAAWDTPITNNSANWNTAYGWGNHAGLYTPIAHKTTEDAINGLVKVDGAGNYSAVTDNSANWNTAYGWGNWASNFGTILGSIAQGNDSRINNGQTAYGWGQGLKLDQTVSQTIANGQPIFDTLTASQLVSTDASKKLQSLGVATYPSLTELTYVKGVTSAIQAQINGKGTFTLPALTLGSVLYSNGSTIIQDNANFFYDGTLHKLGIGTSTLLAKLTVLDTVGTSPRGILSQQISTDTNGARVGFSKARGTLGAETTVVTGDILGRMMFRGYDGTSYLEMGSIEVSSTGTIGTGRVPTFMNFMTATDAATSVLTEAMRITSAQKVGIGTTAPATELSVASTLATSPRGIMSAQYSADALGARFHLRKSRGATVGTDTVVTTGDMLGNTVGSAWDSTQYLESASIDINAEGTIGVGRVPTRISFWTNTDAATSVLTERMRIDSAGLVTLSRPNSLLTFTEALLLTNETASDAVNTVQQSPVIRLRGSGWGSTGSASVTSDWQIVNVPVTSTTTVPNLQFRYSTGGAAYTTALTLSDTGHTSIFAGATQFLLGASFTRSVGASSVAGASLTESSASSAGTPVRYSPYLLFTGHAWNTTVTAADNTINFKQEVRPVSGATTTGNLYWSFDNNGGGYSDIMNIDNYGNLTAVNRIMANIGSMTTVSTDGLASSSSFLATAGATVRYSPRLRFTGFAWNTTTPVSNSINFIQEVRPVSGATTSGSLYWAFDNNGGGYTDKMSLSSAGLLTLPINAIATTNTTALTLSNITAATLAVPAQYSPELHFIGHRWATDTTADNSSEWRIYNQATSGIATSSNFLYIDHSNNGAAYVNAFNLSSGGSGNFIGQVGASTYSNSKTVTTSSIDGYITTSTASSAGTTIRWSPRIRLTAHSWNTTTPADNTINFINEVRPISGATTSGSLFWAFDNNGGGYSDVMSLSSVGALTVITALITTMKAGATQAGAGAAAKELWKTSGHATLPDNVVMIGV